MFVNRSHFKGEFKRKISSMFGKSLTESSASDRYLALASMVRDAINERWVETNESYLGKQCRQVYYFSLEFLMGKYLEQNLLYLGARDVCEKGLEELGIELESLLDTEPDAGLGNGGLGRLAACFLDSLASLGLPGHGCGIRYKYGLFQQKIIDGYQVELPDNWLKGGNAWEIRKPDKAVIVKFGGNVRVDIDENGEAQFTHENYLPVLAVPYDMPLVGYCNNTVNTLRLWSSEAVEHYFDFASFSRGDYLNAVSNRYSVEAISEVLYPDDSNYQNRQLRLKQQYFFVSAGVQSIIRRFKKKAVSLKELPEYVVIQINDTHPAMAVAELMRILIDEENFGWDEAWRVTTSMIAYTNHTIMPEALEKWPVDTFRELLPRLYMIIEEIDRRFCSELGGPYDAARVARMAILGDGHVRMAHLACVGAFSINGVAAVHTELLKSTVLRDFYEYFPEKFNNKTNGITHRRWMIKANPEMADVISGAIGSAWIREPVQLKDLSRYQDDPAMQEAFARIKLENKKKLADYIQGTASVSVDPHSLFDVQVKRIHAYKRQLLNALHILHLYNTIKDTPSLDLQPRTFILAGKAAPSYYHAKNVIKLINEIARLVNADPQVSKILKVVFIENYGVNIAEKIFPASDLSEQISTATKEASGTSNMKFMLNGAVTIGTGDGANIEIREQVGDENFFHFGLSVDEVLAYHANGGYNSSLLVSRDPRLSRILEQLHKGIGPPQDEFVNILRSLLDYNDEFFVLGDFDAYVKTQERVSEAYRDPARWRRMSIVNTAMSGIFSSDNTISQYAREIWQLER